MFTLLFIWIDREMKNWIGLKSRSKRIVGFLRNQVWISRGKNLFLLWSFFLSRFFFIAISLLRVFAPRTFGPFSPKKSRSGKKTRFSLSLQKIVCGFFSRTPSDQENVSKIQCQVECGQSSIAKNKMSKISWNEYLIVEISTWHHCCQWLWLTLH